MKIRANLRALSCLAIQFLLLNPSQAILDQNNNGLSDVWEKQQNNGNLFPITLLATEDNDWDGWSNSKEATAGTSPFNANALDGIVKITILPSLVKGAFTLSWPTLIGKQYQLEVSTDLFDWLSVGDPVIGVSNEHVVGVNTTQPDNTIPAKVFWRIVINDLDDDADKLTNAEEFSLGTDPTLPDSDDDGYSDYEEVEAGSSPTYGQSIPSDRDGDGIANGDDADSDKATIDWTSASEFTYAVIDLNLAAMVTVNGTEPALNAVFNDKNQICRSAASGETTTFFWDGQTYPVVWAPLISQDSFGNSLPDNNNGVSINNSSQIYRSSWIDSLENANGGIISVTPTFEWNTFNSTPVALGITGENQSFDKFARFDHSASEYRQHGQSCTLTAPGFTITRSGVEAESTHFLGKHGFGYKSEAPGITRSGKVLAKVVGQHKIGDINVPFNQFLGIMDDPNENVMLCVVDGAEAVTKRYKSGQWEEIEMPGIIDMGPDGTGLTFPNYQIWRNGETVEFDDIQEDDAWSHYEGYQINRSGFILGSAKKINNLRHPVLLLPAEIVSRDKFFAGSFQIPQGWDSLEMEFSSATENLGRYGDLLGGGDTKIYDRVEDILNEEDYLAGSQEDSQKVWFVKDATDARKIHFYTCFKQTGKASIKLYLSGNPEVVTAFHHTLTPAQEFAEIITYVDQWVRGQHLTFVSQTPPMQMVDPETLHPLTRAALIPVFIVVSQVEGLSTLVTGLWEGVSAGLNDDWTLLVMIKNGVVSAGGWATEQAENELILWRDDPLKRAAELKQLTDMLCENWVFEPLREVREGVSSWQDFQRTSWRAWQKTKERLNRVWAVSKDVWKDIAKGVKEWANDFGDRILDGAERTHWSNHILIMDRFQIESNEYFRQSCYFFGYSYGYICEQVIVGHYVAVGLKFCKVVVKNGVPLASSLALRKVIPIAGRLHIFKMWAASVAISLELKVAVEVGLIRAAETPLTPIIKDSSAEVIERSLAREAYTRTSFSLRNVLDEAIAGGNIKTLFLIPRREGQFFHKLSLFFHTMGDEATAASTKGWVKVYDRLLKFEGNNFADDRAEDLLALYKTSTPEGKVALRKSLEEFGATDGTGKLWFKDVDKIQAQGYRYSNFDPRFDAAGNPVAGAPKLKASDSPPGGWYATFDKLDQSSIARERLQLPPNSSAKYRLEFDWEEVKGNVRVPRGDNHRADWFEPLAKDFPGNGLGGSMQIVVDGVDIPINKIWDVSGTTPVQVYPQP